MANKSSLTLASRFDENWILHEDTGCWLWVGGSGGSGYGVLWVSGRNVGAHRVSHELFIGPIPRGYHIDHLCVIPACVNPNHLEAVTPKINNLRGRGLAAENAVKTHCAHGHEFSLENTYVAARGGSKSSRQCRECARAACRKSYHKLKQITQECAQKDEGVVCH